MSDALWAAVMAAGLGLNIHFWIVSPTKLSASVNAYAAGWNSLGLILLLTGGLS